MAHIRVTEANLKTLEVKTNLAYDVLRRAIEPDDGIERYSLISSAERLYQHDIGAYLQVLTLPATRSFRHLNKGGRRIQKIEKSILQFALMSDPPSSKMGAKRIEIVEDIEDGMGGLRSYLDAEDNLSSAEGEVFRQLQHKATELRKAGRYDLILKALDYVREKYQNH